MLAAHAGICQLRYQSDLRRSQDAMAAAVAAAEAEKQKATSDRRDYRSELRLLRETSEKRGRNIEKHKEQTHDYSAPFYGG